MINYVTNLSDAEKDWWRDQIQQFRKRYIKSPMHCVDETVERMAGILK
jgi:hypothetical protein